MNPKTDPLTFNSTTDFAELNRYFEEQPLETLLAWSLESFGDGVAQVSSFGPTGLVLLDHLMRLSPSINVITIDSGFLFDESYALHEQVQQRYGIQLDVYKPTLTPAAQAIKHGPKLWQTDPNLCCYLRKVVPLQQALQNLTAWFTGLRRDQSVTRHNLSLLAWDQKYNLVKLNPLAGWTREQVWAYISDHNLPYNALHDQRYTSIGCIHCTQAITDLADERSGRWPGSAKTECGIHL